VAQIDSADDYMSGVSRHTHTITLYLKRFGRLEQNKVEVHYLLVMSPRIDKLRNQNRRSTANVESPPANHLPMEMDVEGSSSNTFANVEFVCRENNQMLCRENGEYFVERVDEILEANASLKGKADGTVHRLLAPEDHQKYLKKIATSGEKNKVKSVYLTRCFGGKKRLVIVTMIDDPNKLWTGYKSRVDCNKFFEKLSENKNSNVVDPPPQPSITHGVTQTSRPRYTIEAVEKKLETHEQIITARENGMILVEFRDNYACCYEEAKEEKTRIELIGVDGNSLTPPQHVSELVQIANLGKEEFIKHVCRIEGVDRSATSSIWILEFDNYDYQLRVSGDTKKNLEATWNIPRIEDLLEDETEEPITSCNTSGVFRSIEEQDPQTESRREIGTQYTVHAKHIKVGFPSTDNDLTPHIVRDKHGKWGKMTRGEIEQRRKESPRAYIDVDQGAGFNPKIDKTAIKEVVERFGKFDVTELSIKGVVALPRGETCTLTVIFDIMHADKKAHANDMRSGYVVEHTHVYLVCAVKELFRLSVTEFEKLNGGLHPYVVKAAEAGGVDENKWATQYPADKKKKKSTERYQYRELSPGEDSTIKLLSTLDSITRRLTEMDMKIDDIARKGVR
jgi:hypothetical protein